MSAVALAGLLSAAVVVTVGVAGAGWTIWLGTLLTAIIATWAGAATLRGTRDPEDAPKFRRFAGLALLAAGARHAALLLDFVLPARVLHATYLALAAAIVVLFALAVAHLPASRLPRQPTRIFAESLMIGCAAGAGLYRLVVLHYTDQSHVRLELLCFVFALGGGLAVIAATLDNRPGAITSMTAIFVMITGELVGTVAVTTGATSWSSRVFSLVGLSIAVVGEFRVPTYAPRLSDGDVARLERRHLSVVGTVLVCSAAAFVASLVVRADVDAGAWLCFVGFFLGLWVREITRARQSAEMLLRLHGQAETDPLTRLGNRRALSNRLQQLGDSGSGSVSVLTVDLDGFKDVNDLGGHAVGDELLRAVAEAITEILGPYGYGYRIGGDEFAVVVTASSRRAEELAGQVVDAIPQVLQRVAGARVAVIGASVGLRHVGEAPDESELLTALAESGHAMRAAKRAGRSRVVVFDEKMSAAHRRAKRVEVRLRETQAQALHPNFQPVVCLRTSRVTGVEALARWEDPELGHVPPNEFIEVAEACGLIQAVGDCILRKALSEAAEAGLFDRGLTVAVNVSTIQLRARGFVSGVQQVLAELDVSPACLVVEVTESVFVRQDDPAVKAVAELKALGVAVALDDFGSGYASFAYLPRLPVDIVKLDRSLVDGLEDARTLAIVSSVIDMAHQLGLGVIVEGVERQEQQLTLRALGAEEAQGWLFARAMPTAELVGFLDAQQSPAVALAGPAVLGVRPSLG